MPKDWWYSRNARMVLMKFAAGEMELRDAMARLEAFHEGKGRGVSYKLPSSDQ